MISAQERDTATVQSAELNLGYTKITSPIDGLAGFANYQVGDLVGLVSRCDGQ